MMQNKKQRILLVTYLAGLGMTGVIGFTGGGVLGLAPVANAADKVNAAKELDDVDATVAKKTAAYQWLPGESAHEGLAADESGPPRVILPVVHTQIPKVTADLSKYTRKYTIDLQKFGISNRGTDAVTTSNGLNAALQDAKETGANHIVFPKGTYLISEKIPVVIDHKNTVIDLNGATLQMNTNGLPEYSMVEIVQGAENMRLTNGTLRGDRDTHDYKTIKSSHEDGCLLKIYSGDGLEFDHLTVTNAPGFSIVTRSSGSRNRPELLAQIYHSVMIRDIESGAISETGEKIADPTKTRTGKAYDVSRTGGQFEFGYTAGYMGFPFIKDRNYQVVFLDKDKKFLEKRPALQFRKVAVPANAKFVELEFNQSEVSEEPAHSGAARGTYCGRITNFKSPTDGHFHDNTVIGNRALGIAFCGGQKWILEDNRFEDNGGQAPSYAIDLEDGWEMVQDIVLRNNTFVKNANDLVVCAGSELLIEGNKFEKRVVFLGRAYNYAVKDNEFDGSPISYSTRSGVLNISGNTYRNIPGLSITFDGKGVADGFNHAPGERVQTSPITLANENLTDVKRVTGTYFRFLDSTLDNVNLVAGKSTVLADFQNSKVKDSTLLYEKEGPEVRVNLAGVQGNLQQKGPGLERKEVVAGK